MRVVGYDGFPGHGDPAHCVPSGCSPHLRLSWSHDPTAPLTPAPWVDVLASAAA
jgi:hypothetical protein